MRPTRSAAFVLAIVAVFGVAALAVRDIALSRAVERAERQAGRGFGALAADTLEPYRRRLVSRKTGCLTLVRVYTQAQRVELLEWASQSCMDAGIESPEIAIGLASTHEVRGRDMEALGVLALAAERFDASTEILRRIAWILRRTKRDSDARDIYIKGITIARSDPSFLQEALEYFSGIADWPAAHMAATHLSAMNIEDPGVLLLAARALRKGDNYPQAQPLVEKALKRIAERPELKAALEKTFADVLFESPLQVARRIEDAAQRAVAGTHPSPEKIPNERK